MKSKIIFLAHVFFLLFLTNNIFCMDRVWQLGEIEIPEFAFSVSAHPPLPANLDEISFRNICSINFNFDFFKKIVSMYCCSKLSYLSNSNEWMDSEKLGCPFCIQYDEFSQRCRNLISLKFDAECFLHDIFYAQKLFIDLKTKLITISDLHADFDALMTILNSMHNSGYIDDNLLIRDGDFLIGLGDYVDRKNMSLRTLAFLLIIALKNPGRVILLRGNHEDLNTNLLYDIKTEIKNVFGEEFIGKVYELLVELYELMPSVLYVSQTKIQDVVQPGAQEAFNDFLIFSHALLDFKFDPRKFLDFNNSVLMENGGKCFCAIEQNIFKDEDAFDVPLVGHGFVWHDIGLKNSFIVDLDPKSNRYKYKPEYVKSFCKKYSSRVNVIAGMVGGHDHFFATRVDKDPRGFASAVGYVKVFNVTDEIKTGPVCAQDKDGVCFSNGFTMVKFVSAPMDGIAYNPTYLIINRCIEISMDFRVAWNYKVVEAT